MSKKTVTLTVTLEFEHACNPDELEQVRDDVGEALMDYIGHTGLAPNSAVSTVAVTVDIPDAMNVEERTWHPYGY